MPNSFFFIEGQQWYYLTHSYQDNAAFPKGICRKVNIIVRLEFEHANYDSVVQHFNHYTTAMIVPLNGGNGYRRRKWTRRHEFKSWTRLIAFHIALIPLGKV